MITISSAFESDLDQILLMFPKIDYKTDEPLKNHTSLRIGGPAKIMFFPADTDELAALCRSLRGYGINPLVIGNGTNLLVDDKPLDIAVIKTTRLNAITLGRCDGSGANDADRDSLITADCGAKLSQIAVFASENGLSGLEFAHGIPGTLGGAVTMNAGAYEGEMKDIVRETIAFDLEKGILTIDAERHGFAYRKSCFLDSGMIVLSTTMRLFESNRAIIKAKMDELAERRRMTQPLDLPNAGSSFKRPAGGFAAAMIQEAGLKGYSVGGAQVSEKHSGFIVNQGGATFSDMMRLIDHIRETVLKRTGVELELEIKVIRG